VKNERKKIILISIKGAPSVNIIHPLILTLSQCPVRESHMSKLEN
jgi:hypothetical protein